MDFDHLLAEGLAASREGRRAAALELFAQASAAQPASGLPHFLIASEQASAGEFAAAEHAFASAVLLAPGFPLARYQLGLLQFSSGRTAVALLTWEPLLALPEGDALLHFVRGFMDLARGDDAQSLRHFRAGLACRPDNPALRSDVEQLVARIEASQAPPAQEPPAADHVLLAAYANRVH